MCCTFTCDLKCGICGFSDRVEMKHQFKDDGWGYHKDAFNALCLRLENLPDGSVFNNGVSYVGSESEAFHKVFIDSTYLCKNCIKLENKPFPKDVEEYLNDTRWLKT